MADNKTNTINPNGLAIYNALKANEGKTLTFAEIANLAGIEAKTGYLTAARKIAKDNGYTIAKIEKGAKATIRTITVYPNGLTLEKEKEAILDGYTLTPADTAEAAD